jgi:hypothetical protein
LETGTTNPSLSSTDPVPRADRPTGRAGLRLLTAFVIAGLTLSLIALLAETYWGSLNRYEQSSAISKTVGRQKLVWDLRTSTNSSQLGTPKSKIVVGDDPEWLWEGPYDVDILLPEGRELRTDTLLVSARIVDGTVGSISINGGTLLSPKDMRMKVLDEVRLMRPNRRGDGADGTEAIDQWYNSSLSKRDSGGAIWMIREQPSIIARIRDMSGGQYIEQYELFWH